MSQNKPTVTMDLMSGSSLSEIGPTIPGSAMPSGMPYVPDSNGQISARGEDIGALIALGFFIQTIDCGVLGQ